MKKIKPIVLKDATKLSINEMKQIKGGWIEETSSTACSATCYHSTGAIVGYTSIDCSRYNPKAVCKINHDGNKLIAQCFLYEQLIGKDSGCENIILDPPIENF